MKNLYLIPLLCLFIQAHAMECPFGRQHGEIRQAMALISKKEKEKKTDGFRKLVQLSAGGDCEATYNIACTYEYGVLSDDKPNFNLAFINMKKSADNGYGPAYVKMGEYYKNGYGVTPDSEKAKEYYQKAREYYGKGVRYGDGIALINKKVADIEYSRLSLIIDKDDSSKISEALKILLDQSKRNSVDATIALAEHYEGEADFSQAEVYYQRALGLDPQSQEAQVRLGNLYLSRFLGDAQRTEKALEYLKNAAESNPIAAFRIASYFYDIEEFKKAQVYLQFVRDPHFLEHKYLLEGLLYSHERNIHRDLSKSLTFFDRAIEKKPQNITALFGIWRIWLESPEKIQDEQRIKDILEKLFNSYDPQALFKLGLGYRYGIYGLEKNDSKAAICFKRVRENTSIDSDPLRALMYIEGIGVKKDLVKGLKALERSHLKSKWSHELYINTQADIETQLLELDQKEKKSAEKLPPIKASGESAGKQRQAQPMSSQADEGQIPVIETQDTEEFEQEPEDTALQEEFKQSLIEKITTTYKPADGSFVKTIHFDTREIHIDDPRNNKEIILCYEDAIKDRRKRRLVKHLRYHPRVESWFSKTAEELAQTYDTSTIENHRFARIVDYYIQLYGIPIPRTDGKRELILPGTIIDKITGRKERTIFEYTFYKDQQDGPNVLYHRLARPIFK